MPPAHPASKTLSAFGAVTAAYWAFMLTDGALRMLVLLHFHTLGFSPVQLAFLFLLYEVAGVVTNLSAGWLAARYGLRTTLFWGLGLQILALAALTLLNPAWTLGASVAFVMAVQGVSGIAKDLTKMSAKSAVKILAPSADKGLFTWVAGLTGSKNALKGLGFFLGALMLGLFGFTGSILTMAALLTLIFLALLRWPPAALPSGSKTSKFHEVWAKDPRINRLSLARLFLFGARDVWFVVGIPVFFYTVWSDGTTVGNRTAFFLIGGFIAAWIILYGLVQGLAPRLMQARQKSWPTLLRQGQFLLLALACLPLCLAAIVAAQFLANPMLTLLVVLGLLLFGGLFALQSSLHSFLILSFTNADRVTLDVGFYYMANAAGRLVGTLLSGLSYSLGGLPACLCVAGLMLLASYLSAQKIRAEGPLKATD